tara:strand:+ start:374 stop:841 length:468 start_codon:yes stop_codon:yes gene_type:complete
MAKKPDKQELKIIEDGIKNFDVNGRVGENRHILIVTDYTVIVSNWRVSMHNKKTASRSTIQLTGYPSPNSSPMLRTAILTFVPDGESVRRPVAKSDGSGFYLFLHNSNLATVLSMLSDHATLYCWIGEFADGHIYGDIHGSTKLNTSPVPSQSRE